MGDLRLFLFDMDGTLMVNQWEYHLSVVSMLKRLRTQGDMVILCTGRSRAHIPMEIWRQTDGAILLNGACCIYNNCVFLDRPLQEEMLIKCLDIGQALGIPMYLESNAHMAFWGTPEDFAKWGEDNGRLVELFDCQISCYREWKQQYGGEPIYKIDVASKCFQTYCYELMRQGIPCEQTDGGAGCHEILSPGVSKGNGLKLLLENVKRKDPVVICFGDGVNDISMFQNSDLCIAMGNAAPELKQIADYVTDSVENDGCEKALRILKLYEAID